MKIIITEQQNESLTKKVKLTIQKIGVTEAINLFGKEIIKNAYGENPESYLDNYKKLKRVEKDEYVGYFDDANNLILIYSIEDEEDGIGHYRLNYDRIWSFFENVLDYDDNETIETLEHYVSTNLGITDLPVDYFKEESFKNPFN